MTDVTEPAHRRRKLQSLTDTLVNLRGQYQGALAYVRGNTQTLRASRHCKRECHRINLAIADIVNTFNALTLPKCYIYVDDATSWIHLVSVQIVPFRLVVDDRGWNDMVPNELITQHVVFNVDFVWHFDAKTGLWNSVKDRTQSLSSLCPVKCGGMQQCKSHST